MFEQAHLCSEQLDAALEASGDGERHRRVAERRRDVRIDVRHVEQRRQCWLVAVRTGAMQCRFRIHLTDCLVAKRNVTLLVRLRFEH